MSAYGANLLSRGSGLGLGTRLAPVCSARQLVASTPWVVRKEAFGTGIVHASGEEVQLSVGAMGKTSLRFFG